MYEISCLLLPVPNIGDGPFNIQGGGGGGAGGVIFLKKIVCFPTDAKK